MTQDAVKDAANTAELDTKKPADANAVGHVRKCMMCKSEFPSGWSGERICRKCKSTDKWRSA